MPFFHLFNNLPNGYHDCHYYTSNVNMGSESLSKWPRSTGLLSIKANHKSRASCFMLLSSLQVLVGVLFLFPLPKMMRFSRESIFACFDRADSHPTPAQVSDGLTLSRADWDLFKAGFASFLKLLDNLYFKHPCRRKPYRCTHPPVLPSEEGEVTTVVTT